jgi:anaphase-promoting complex subunit 1
MDKKTSVFMAHDLDGSELICILDKHNNILTGINVTALVNVRKGRGVKAFEMKASAAVPIMSTRTECFDILILQDGQIKLWIGSGTHLVDISLPDNIADSDNDMSLFAEKSSQKHFRTLVRQLSISEEPLSVIDLKDAVFNRVNVVLTDARIYRITVDFTPKTGLIQDCLTALSFALPINVFQYIRQRFMWHCSLRSQQLSETDTVDTEWDNFVSAILCFLYKDARARKELADALHRYVEIDQSTSLQETVVQDVISTLHLGNSTQSIVDGIPSNDLPQHCHKRVEKWILNSLESCEQKAPEESLLANTSSVLLALHILWEDLRLDKYRRQDFQNLGLFLYQLVTMQQWETWSAYYSDRGIDDLTFLHPGRPHLLDCAMAHAGWYFINKYFLLSAMLLEQQDSNLKNFPPDFTAWIHEQLQGADSSRGQLPPFLLPQDVFPYPGMVANPSRRKKSLCHTIQKLSLFFNAYSDPMRDSSSVVLLLIAEDYKQSDLAKLPAEISKPLYDLLESYTMQPPLDWPIEAYLLIGNTKCANLTRWILY